jgi:hypothetical protein
MSEWVVAQLAIRLFVSPFVDGRAEFVDGGAPFDSLYN